MFLQKAFKDLFFFNRFFLGGRAGYDNQIIQPLTFRMTGGALRQTSGHLILKSFQNFNKPGIPDYGIIGDNWQVKISGGCSNKPVMQLGDVVDLGSGFKNLKA